MSRAAVPKAITEAQRAGLDTGVFLVPRDDAFAFPTGVGMNRKRLALVAYSPHHLLPTPQRLQHRIAERQRFRQGPARLL